MRLYSILESIYSIPSKLISTRAFRINFPDLISARNECYTFQKQNASKAGKILYSFFDPGYEKLTEELEKQSDSEIPFYCLIVSPKSATSDAGLISLITNTDDKPKNTIYIYITSDPIIDPAYSSLFEEYDYDPYPSMNTEKVLNGLSTATKKDYMLNDEIVSLLSSLERIIHPSKIVNRLGVFIKDAYERRIDNFEVALIDYLKDLRMTMINKIPSMHIEEPVKADDVIGIDDLKHWITQRFNNPIQGQHPKGILIVGVPGCGKSMTAKATGSIINVPVIRYNPVASFSGILGSTEQNIRRDLDIINSLGRCVVFIDEIEKQLAGSSSSDKSDAGSTSRSIQQIISWMQDRKSEAFLVATANSFETLPKELLRTDRIDEIFFMDLPSKATRARLLRHYIYKLNSPLTNSINDDIINTMAVAMEGYNGSDIKAIITEFYYKYLDSADISKPWNILDDMIRRQTFLPFSVKFPERVKEVQSVKNRYKIIS